MPPSQSRELELRLITSHSIPTPRSCYVGGGRAINSGALSSALVSQKHRYALSRLECLCVIHRAVSETLWQFVRNRASPANSPPIHLRDDVFSHASCWSSSPTKMPSTPVIPTQPSLAAHQIRSIMEADGAFQLEKRIPLPFLIREHARKFQWGCSDGIVWRRAS